MTVSGTEWLVRRAGAIIPNVYEKVQSPAHATHAHHVQVVRVIDAKVLDYNTALHLEAVLTHTDQLGNKRTAGESWCVA